MDSDNIPKSIDEYIAGYPEDVQKKLTEMREAIRKAAPDAEEKISYRMPAFTLKGMLVYFAAHTRHLGFYPFASAIKTFSSQLTRYHTSKGGIQFPYKDSLPLDLIGKIVEFRVRENLFKAEVKALNKRTTWKDQ